MANPFTKEGKEFAGWATASDGNVRYGDQAQVQSLTTEAGGTVTLYAVWRTPISEIQKPYLDRLDAAFQRYTQGDYPTQDWGTLSGAYTAAVNQIQGTESTVTMDRAVSNAQTAMAAVPTLADRVEEITQSWTEEHTTALNSVSAGLLTESNAGQTPDWLRRP